MKMRRRKIMKKLITLSVLLVVSIIGLIVGYQNLNVDEVLENNFVKIPFLTNEQPVAKTLNTFGKPFKSEDVEVAVEFYDSAKENQEKAIIVINKTFIPNRGILYKADKEFEVLAIYDGTISDITKDDLLGTIVKVSHENGLVSTYKILKDVSLNIGDYVKKGDKIGTSATSEIMTGNLLMFELSISDVFVNPIDYYDKTIKEI